MARSTEHTPSSASPVRGTRRGRRHIRVIINPLAGREGPVLKSLTRKMRAAGIDWDIAVMSHEGDGYHLAHDAVTAGVDIVAVYGGDGTVTEVAGALLGSAVSLAILPGGTGNVMAIELGIPLDLQAAIQVLLDPAHGIRLVDMIRIDNHPILLRAGVGLEAEMVERAGPEMKDRFGQLAYAVSALGALRTPLTARYLLNIDGRQVESEGVTCLIANSGNLSRAGLTLAPTIAIDDGLLDIIVLRSADMISLLTLVAGVVRGSEDIPQLQHWQARAVSLIADPVQRVEADGEIIGTTPVAAHIIPHAIHIIVPGPVMLPIEQPPHVAR